MPVSSAATTHSEVIMYDAVTASYVRSIMTIEFVATIDIDPTVRTRIKLAEDAANSIINAIRH